MTSSKTSFLKRFYSPFGLCLCLFVVLLACLVQGLIRQEEVPFGEDFLSRIGLRSFKDSAFMLSALLLLLVCGGMFCVHRFIHRTRCFSNLIYAGIWLTVFSLLAGSACLKRYNMTLWKGYARWQVESPDERGGVKELPFALQLMDFRIDYHAPTLFMVDTRTGLPLPERHPQTLNVNAKQVEAYRAGKADAQEQTILGHKVRVLEYLPLAAIQEDSLGGYFCVPAPIAGNSPAVEVEITDPDGSPHREWICAGSKIQIPLFVRTDTNQALCMAKPQVKRYNATLQVYSLGEGRGRLEGQSRIDSVGANRPLRVGRYRVYLKSYKEDYGFWDPYVSFEVVKDPLEPVTYTGFALIFVGLVGHILQNSLRRRKSAAQPKTEQP